MRPKIATAVKICGITRVEDALVAAHAGAQAIGLIFYAGSPRRVSHDIACRVFDALPPFVTPVALFVDATSADVERVIGEVKPQLLQFHGDETPEFCGSFGMPYIKAAKVRQGVDLLQYARHYRRGKRSAARRVRGWQSWRHGIHFRLDADPGSTFPAADSRRWLASRQCRRRDTSHSPLGGRRQHRC